VGLGGHAQWLRGSSGEEGEGRGGRTVGVGEVVRLKHGWCVVQGVVAGHYVQVLYLQDNQLQSVCVYLQVKGR
jgi:hypothetical protein